MDISKIVKPALPHVIAVVLFTLVSFLFFHPVLEGKKLSANDTRMFAGSAKEIQDYRQETGKEPLWTNSMFGGMPSYLISVRFPGNLIKPLESLLKAFKTPVAALFLSLLGFYLLLLLYKVKPWQALAGALAYGFASYLFIALSAGHNTKAYAMAYMAPVLGSVIYAFRNNALRGGVLMALFLTLQLMANHLQMTYYTLLIVLVFGIFEFISLIKEKNISGFFKPFLMLSIGVVLAIGINFGTIYTTWEYSKYSTRGTSDLKKADVKEEKGLNKAYITQWSYGIDETMTLLIPDFRGGASEPFDKNSETVKALKKNNMSQAAAQLGSYWGEQPGTSGPVYAGAIVLFLFVLGLIIVPGKEKWWILTAVILSIVLSWGKNLGFITNLFIDYFPGYDKFRAVSMTLVMAGVCIPLLAGLAMRQVYDKNISREAVIKAVKIAAAITGGIALLFFLLPSLAGSFLSGYEKDFPSNYDWLKSALISDRKMMLRVDAIRSAVLIFAAAAIIWLTIKEKIKTTHSIIILSLLVLIDLWPVANRYMNSGNFSKKQAYNKLFDPTYADKSIMEDKSEHRVLNLTVSTFNDGTTSYFHHSIGGYHGAKLMRYDELISRGLSQEINSLKSSLQKGSTIDELNNILSRSNALNILNTKYIIISPDQSPILNQNALGNVWLVGKIRFVENANEELDAISSIKPANEAVVDRKFSSVASLNDATVSPGDTIFLNSYKPNLLTYSCSSKTNRIAVFSEIYYPAGWNAFIDNKPADYFRADYVLRAIQIPAGEHTITFSFNPPSYKTGNSISLASSLILILLIAGIAVNEIIKLRKNG